MTAASLSERRQLSERAEPIDYTELHQSGDAARGLCREQQPNR